MESIISNLKKILNKVDTLACYCNFFSFQTGYGYSQY